MSRLREIAVGRGKIAKLMYSGRPRIHHAPRTCPCGRPGIVLQQRSRVTGEIAIYYTAKCRICLDKNRKRVRSTRTLLASACERCGFQPEIPSQLHAVNVPELKTLCANCQVMWKMTQTCLNRLTPRTHLETRAGNRVTSRIHGDLTLSQRRETA